MKILFSLMALLSSALLMLFPLSSYNEPIKNREEIMTAVDSFLPTIPSLPRYAEGGYSPLGRSPVVDAILADPLYLPIYAEIVAGIIKEKTSQELLNPLASALFTAGGIPLPPIQNTTFPLKQKVPDLFMRAFPRETAQKLYSYWTTFQAIHREVEHVLKALTEEEKEWLKSNYYAFFFGNQDPISDYDFFTTYNPNPLKFYSIAAKLDLSKLADQARQLAHIADDLYFSRETFENLALDEDFMWEENGLKLILSTRNHVEHREEADFFIDLGGNNTIFSNAGGTQGVRPLALHIDLKGHNTYQGQNFVQGTGFLGVGLLYCCSGDNVFQADSYAQGCGLFGVGMLVNHEGNNHFQMNFGGQSFALFGASLLWNKEGKNQYIATQGMAQAASSTQGIAFLIDNQGENSYTSGVPGKGGTTREGGIGQGGSSGVRNDPWLNNPSFYGGLSFLFLGGGSNTLKTVWLGQGSSYFLGTGIVVAEGSNDTFQADYDSQGQGLHLSAGLVLKKGGHSSFKGGWGSLGVSGDKSIGMFLSFAGKNRYEGTDQSVGTSRKPKSVGIFIDIGGDNEYIFQKISNANLQYPQHPTEWSSAIFLEVGKESRYPQNVDDFIRGNEKMWGIKNHSIGIATLSLENAKETLWNKFHSTPITPFPFDPVQGWISNTTFTPLETNPDKAQSIAHEIFTADYDRRRQIYESLDLMRFNDRKVDPSLSYLLKIPTIIPEDAFNYAVLWALRNKEKADLTRIKQALASEAFQSEYARKMAVSLVGSFWTPDSAPLLNKIMNEDKSESIRYYAALALAINLPENEMDILKEGTKSDSELVRYAIAKGLQESKNPSALTIVTPLFDDESFYVRRAAGITAISLRDKQGVSVILDTLKYETLDTGDNYGDNIFARLSTYLGVDFGLDKDAWINWWHQNKDHFQFPKHDPR